MGKRKSSRKNQKKDPRIKKQEEETKSSEEETKEEKQEDALNGETNPNKEETEEIVEEGEEGEEGFANIEEFGGKEENFDFYSPEEDTIDVKDLNLDVSCKHIEKVNVHSIRESKAMLLKSNYSCKSCTEKLKGKHKSKKYANEATWICLTCANIGCGRDSKNRHAEKHFDKFKHPIVVSPEDKKVWCYICDDYVSLGDEKSSLRSALKVLGFLDQTPQEEENHSKKKKEKKKEKAPESDNEEVNKVVELFKGDSPANPLGIHGLNNLGNTCFFNSVMQNLFNTIPLQTNLLELSKPKGPLTVALIIFFNMMRSSGNNSISPKSLFSEIARRAPRFKGYNQQDSHELLCYLLDGVDIEEKERLKSINAPKDSKNVLENIFGGQLTSTVICHACKTVSTVHEKIMDLSLPIPDRFVERKKHVPVHIPKSKKNSKKHRSEKFYEMDEETETKEEKVSKNIDLEPELIPFQRPKLEDTTCSLMACINEFTKPEILDGENGFGCIECTKRSLAQKGEKFPKETNGEPEKKEEQSESATSDPPKKEETKDLKKEEIRDLKKEETRDPFSISISQLKTYIQKAFFDKEYAAIDQKSQFQYSFEAANANKVRNRYSNVLAPDASRVKLETFKQSDYINANYIPGLIPGSEKKYIATQGPLEDTTADFWRMVWETGCVVVLMLTKEIENSWVKCDPYYPSSSQRAFHAGEFTIELVDADETPELTRRNLLLKLEGNERKIHHLHYTEWPDHGLPVSTTHFLQLLHFANEVNHSNGPFIVHCSAGLGRSGVFCAVHSITEKIKYDLSNGVKDPIINLVDTIANMRKQRPAMVQTADQFKFCYFALVEAVDEIGKEQPSPTSNDSPVVPEEDVPSKPTKGGNKSKEKEKGKEPKVKLIKRRATKQFMIHEQPRVLILHLKRFMQTSRSLEKISTRVSFPLSFEMNEYCDVNLKPDSNSPPPPVYQYTLNGIVSHSGSLNSGHYVAYVKKQSQTASQWFYFSDSHFSPVRESDVLSQEAYLLFYERVENKHE